MYLNPLNLINPLNLFFRGVYTPIVIIVSPYGLFGNPECGKKKHSGLTFSEGFTHPSLLSCRPTGFNVSKPSKPYQPSKPFFPRGLHTHRYHCVALKGFLETRNVERKNTRGLHFPRGLHTHRYKSVALRAFRKPGMWKEKTLGAYISRGVYTPIAIKVSP